MELSIFNQIIVLVVVIGLVVVFLISPDLIKRIIDFIPVSSVVQICTNQGLRYLYCNLCEAEWHVVWAKCSNVEQTKYLHYCSLQSEYTAIKAESCHHCGSY